MFCTMGEESRMKREKLGGSESLRIRRPRGVKHSSLFEYSVLLEFCSVLTKPFVYLVWIIPILYQIDLRLQLQRILDI
jgi:hypothetical protein